MLRWLAAHARQDVGCEAVLSATVQAPQTAHHEREHRHRGDDAEGQPSRRQLPHDAVRTGSGRGTGDPLTGPGSRAPHRAPASRVSAHAGFDPYRGRVPVRPPASARRPVAPCPAAAPGDRRQAAVTSAVCAHASSYASIEAASRGATGSAICRDRPARRRSRRAALPHRRPPGPPRRGTPARPPGSAGCRE